MHIPFNFENKVAKIFLNRNYTYTYVHVQHGLDQSYFGDSTVFCWFRYCYSMNLSDNAVLDKTSSSVIFNLGYKSWYSAVYKLFGPLIRGISTLSKLVCTTYFHTISHITYVQWRRSAVNSAGALRGISGNFHPKNLPMYILYYKSPGRAEKQGCTCPPGTP